MEGLGYAAITETPCVIIDIQRAGPATGQATRVASGDILQVRYGSHGDYCPIALAPWSVQEIYDLTIRAFNLAENPISDSSIRWSYIPSDGSFEVGEG